MTTTLEKLQERARKRHTQKSKHKAIVVKKNIKQQEAIDLAAKKLQASREAVQSRYEDDLMAQILRADFMDDGEKKKEVVKVEINLQKIMAAPPKKKIPVPDPIQKKPEPFIRAKATYTNIPSPYGIATELLQQQLEDEIKHRKESEGR